MFSTLGNITNFGWESLSELEADMFQALIRERLAVK